MMANHNYIVSRKSLPYGSEAEGAERNRTERHTAREKSVFGEDGDRVDDQTGDCIVEGVSTKMIRAEQCGG